MYLKEFLDQTTSDGNLFRIGSVTCFAVKEMHAIPIVFLSHVIANARAQGAMIESIDFSDRTLAHVVAQLETSFLGMGLTYYLRNCQDLDKKNRQSLFEYLATYQGPHQILLCALNEDGVRLNKQYLVEIPDAIPAPALLALFNFLKKKSNPAIQKFIQSLCVSYTNITLDQACMIISYMQVIGKFDECSQVLERILESEQSLFTLSQYFFAKDASAFFKRWALIESEYPMTFWCTYWSEQLWRAYYARYYLDHNQPLQAKSLGYRLPFSYLQKDWKKSSLQELKNAHQSIYELDFAYKNNIETQVGIELFYTKFFQNQF
jgi:hypothetical protein